MKKRVFLENCYLKKLVHITPFFLFQKKTFLQPCVLVSRLLFKLDSLHTFLIHYQANWKHVFSFQKSRSMVECRFRNSQKILNLNRAEYVLQSQELKNNGIQENKTR